MLRRVLSRTTAAAGRRAGDCARLRRPACRARRPPSGPSRRAERRPGRAEGAGRLAQQVAAAAGLHQARMRPMRRTDGADWCSDMHERDLSPVRSQERLQLVQFKIAAEVTRQLLQDATAPRTKARSAAAGRWTRRSTRRRVDRAADRAWPRTRCKVRARYRHEKAGCSCSSRQQADF